MRTRPTRARLPSRPPSWWERKRWAARPEGGGASYGYEEVVRRRDRVGKQAGAAGAVVSRCAAYGHHGARPHRVVGLPGRGHAPHRPDVPDGGLGVVHGPVRGGGGVRGGDGRERRRGSHGGGRAGRRGHRSRRHRSARGGGRAHGAVRGVHSQGGPLDRRPPGARRRDRAVLAGRAAHGRVRGHGPVLRGARARACRARQGRQVRRRLRGRFPCSGRRRRGLGRAVGGPSVARSRR